MRFLSVVAGLAFTSRVLAQELPKPPNCDPVKRKQEPPYGNLGLTVAIGRILVDNADVRKCKALVAARTKADSEAVVRRLETHRAVFLPKARMVIQQSVDTLVLSDSAYLRFWSDAFAAVDNLWMLKQEASTDDIREVVNPVVSEYRRRRDE